MSVIQDALKRKLLDQQAGRAARPARSAGPAGPPPTPPLAQQVLRREEETARAAAVSAGGVPGPAAPAPGAGRWILGTALVLLFAVLVAGVLLYLHRGVPLVAVPPPTAAVPDSPPAVPPPAPVAGEPAPATAAAEAAVAEPAVPAPDPEPAPASAWPAIVVEGVVAGADPGRRSAMLNGQMVFLNQRIEGVRLVEVTDQGVRLRYQGQDRFLEIGQLTTDGED